MSRPREKPSGVRSIVVTSVLMPVLARQPEPSSTPKFAAYELVLPTSINTSYLDDEHLGVLKRVLSVEIGVSVTDADFSPPKRSPE